MKKVIAISALTAFSLAMFTSCRTQAENPYSEDDQYDARSAYEEMYQEEMDDYYYEYLGY